MMDSNENSNYTHSILYAQKILDIDWYLSKPLKEYDPSFCYLSNSSIKKVPVLRIFGPTPTGQSGCLHIHGVFPYLYIPLPVGVDPSPHWIGELSRGINNAIKSAISSTDQCSHHVYDIKIVAAKPFYGYHPTRRIFLQIFLYDPRHVRILADILLTGSVMKTPLQPHEAHIPYQLQFMIDYNLYGMNHIYLAEVQFRFSPEDAEEPLYSPSTDRSSTFFSRVWTLSSLQKELLHAESRHSNCDLELDALYHSILNPSLFSEANNPGLAVLWEDERWRRKQEGLSPDVTLPLEINRDVKCSIDESQLILQFEAMILKRMESHKEKGDSIPVISLSTSQLPEREEVNTSLLLSPSSLQAAGENQVISMLTELDMGILNGNERQFNMDGRVVNLPSNRPTVDESLSNSVSSELLAMSNASILLNATHSFNLSLIRNRFLEASLEHLPSEYHGKILSYDTSLDPETSISLFEDMISESILLSQPLNFGISPTNENIPYLPPLQLDGNGCRGRKKSSKTKLIVQNSYKSKTENISSQSTAIDSVLCVSIPRQLLTENFNLEQRAVLPFPKQPILKIARLDLSKLRIKQNTNYIQGLPQHDICLQNDVITESPVHQPGIDSLDTIRPCSFDHNSGRNVSPQCDSHIVGGVLDFPPPSVYPDLHTHAPFPSDNISEKVEDNSTGNRDIVTSNNTMLQLSESYTISEEASSTAVSQVEELFDIAEKTATNHSLLEPTSVLCVTDPIVHFSSPASEKNALIDQVTVTENENVIEGKHDLTIIVNTPNSNSLVSSEEFSNDYMSPKEELSNEEIKDIFHSPNSNDNPPEASSYSEAPPIPQPTRTPSVSSAVSNQTIENPEFNLYRVKSPQPEHGLPIISQLNVTDVQNTEVVSSSHQLNENINPSLDIIESHSPEQSSSDTRILGLEPPDYQLSVSPISENSEHIAIQVSVLNSLHNSPASSSGLLSSDTTLSPSHSQANSSSNHSIPVDDPIDKSDARYSSVSSESESDNCEYQFSNSLLVRNTGDRENKTLNTLDSELGLIEKTDSSLPLEKNHSTPLINRSSNSSPTENTSQDSFSPILKETISHPSHSQLTQLDLNDNNSSLPMDQTSSEHLPKPSLQKSVDYIPYEKLISSLTQTQPNLTYYSQIEGPTLANLYNFKLNSQELHDIYAIESRVCQFLTVMSVEILVRTRSELSPDPNFDSLLAICYFVSTHEYHSHEVIYISGILSLTDTWDIEDLKKCDSLAHTNLDDVIMTYVTTEVDLFQEFISKVLEYDPDICVGFESQRSSWGYLIERACMLVIDLPFCLSRAQPPGKTPRDNLKEAPYCFNYSDPHIVGRILLNLWRICKHELTLTGYTFENVAHHTLHQRYTKFSNDILTKWYTVFPSRNRWRPLQYYILRAQANIRIIEALDIVERTSELSRLFGIEFYNVLARGTQYRVESMMIRLLKRHEYITVSPSVRQRSKMLPPSVIPLILEPRDNYFTDPVVVLDFQSLYPSIIIAHNYCYSTCLGKLEHLPKDSVFPFGAIDLEIPLHILGDLKPSDVTISPNGVVFVKPHIRKGMLPIMLEEILRTRIMVKQALKRNKSTPYLHKVLNARQLGLKNIANVTFGYTQANFSGRMPCVDLGDSIVAKARETLERSIDLVLNSTEWNVQVIYGDTDSMFILLPGISREEAFKIGYEITKKVTRMFSEPIKLKFEKVYQPCLLMTKKRYVGFSFETPEQIEPKFDAKGIETVRRDTCPAVAKLLEQSLKILFRTGEMEQVRGYVVQQCTKLFRGLVSIQDLTFAREFRGLYGYQPGVMTPSLHISQDKISRDPRSEPRVGSRVPYVYVYSHPNSPLIDLIRTPEQVLADSSLYIHAHYYLHTHIIPSLKRALDRAGANVHSWINDFPQFFRPTHYDLLNPIEKRGLSNFIDNRFCAICDDEGEIGLCRQCVTDLDRKHTLIGKRFQVSNHSVNSVNHLCKSCQGDSWAKDCISTDCPILYKRLKLTEELSYAKRLSDMYLSHNFDLTF
ncbi:hypothetical protein LOD99_10895 [Oopsacas minuta]|uniref:DNA polymerase zeta catalytic subunit n=1 Tax=Oopsacas minuta TaxID=111878 RepID=A0AAV7KDG0_9METZ|nr:hypothetical protein LOD99_10895 [Oopsacas minuta]